jgi:hypothetical protein
MDPKLALTLGLPDFAGLLPTQPRPNTSGGGPIAATKAKQFGFQIPGWISTGTKCQVGDFWGIGLSRLFY